jgi:pyruvate dehydrogenase E2 component (dihydrolipoamide acetyltransferase)
MGNYYWENYSGFVAKIVIEPGVEVKVGQIVAVVVENKEDIAAFANYTPPAPKAAKPAEPAPPLKQAEPTPIKAKAEPGNIFLFTFNFNIEI